MENSNGKKYRRLSKSELKARLGEDKFNEYENLNKQIQDFQKKKKNAEDFLNKLPDMELIARTVVEKSFKENPNISSWNRGFYYGRFVDVNVKETEKILRLAFKDSPRKKIVNPQFLLTSIEVYVDSTIQAFFEFSLQYSFYKQAKLSLKQAQGLFINASRVAIGLPVKNKKMAEQLKYYLDAMNAQGGIFDFSNMAAGVGKPKGSTETTKKRERYKRQGFNEREIVMIEFPYLSPEGKRKLTNREKDLLKSKEETVKRSLNRSKKSADK